MSRAYTSTRPRGLARWRPQAATRVLLGQVDEVLTEYADALPLTCRQVFYRLVGAYGYAKNDNAYERLLEKLNRARRAELIPFASIRDDGVAVAAPAGFYGVADFWDAVADTAASYRRVRREGQTAAVEVWCEAAGMVPQLARVAHQYGAPVYSAGGFDSTTVKHDAVRRALAEDRPTVVLQIGDHDPSGWSMFDAAAEDIAAFIADYGGTHPVRFERVAVTPEQIASYGLPEAPVKPKDRRGDWQGGTVQAEALSPAQLADELRAALDDVYDLDVLDRLVDTETTERDQMLARLDAGGAA